MASATRREIEATAASAVADASKMLSQCSLVIISVWPRVTGKRSMKVSVRASSCTRAAGASPETMRQKMQLLSRCMRGSLPFARLQWAGAPRIDHRRKHEQELDSVEHGVGNHARQQVA